MTRSGDRRLALSLAVAAMCVGWGGRAAGEPAAQPSHSLSARLGVQIAERLLASDAPEDRWRGLERLGSIGSSRALERLVRALDERPGADGRGRLVAARALAAHADRDLARQALVQLMTSAGSGSDPADRMAPLVRSTAALALAESGSSDALRALAHAIRTEGPAGAAAVDALLAHPPHELAPLIGQRGGVSTSWVELLADLGDQRAFLPVRRAIMAGPADVRGAAAVALTRLGAFETVELARHWQKTHAGPTLERAAAEILVLARAPDATAAIERLLDDPQQRDTGIELAMRSASPALVVPLSKLLPTASKPEVNRLVAALGRCGGDAALHQLEVGLDDARLASSSAYALALAEGSAATRALQRALERESVRRLAARAAVVRVQVLGDEPRGTRQVLERLVASADPRDRYVGAWGIASLDARRAVDWLEGDDAMLAAAAVVAARNTDVAVAAAARLEKAETVRERITYALALAVPEGADRVSTATLLALCGDGGAAAPLGAQALTARDAPRVRPYVQRLLESDAVAIRAHAALGLGASRDASSVGLLAEAYRFEPDADVRRAIVTALGQRRESARRQTLELAARLDGDPDVRAVARLALAGQRVDLQAAGGEAVWLQVDPPGGFAVMLGLPTGRWIPLMPDPEGYVVLGRLPQGPVRVRLAELPRDGKARDPGKRP